VLNMAALAGRATPPVVFTHGHAGIRRVALLETTKTLAGALSFEGIVGLDDEGLDRSVTQWVLSLDQLSLRASAASVTSPRFAFNHQRRSAGC
jgi:hypothetical protein